MGTQIYPLGVQNFPKIRLNNMVYVDKTAILHHLVTTAQYVFLSRPRRFGKSLLVSTLEEYFLGHKELFEGLAVCDLQPGEWPSYPVIHLDLSQVSYATTEELNKSLFLLLKPYEEVYGADPDEITPGLRLGGIINRAHRQTGRPVVVLIDEYDLPLVNSLDSPELLEAHRTALKDFYSKLKGRDGMLRFVLLTGVGKLGQLNVFSGLNNIRDISIDNEYAAICGITEDELHRYFDEGVGELADEYGISKEEAYGALKRQYDGYHFSKNLTDVYNPFSLLYCLTRKEMYDYWFRSGTPSHLIKVLRQDLADITNLDGTNVRQSDLLEADVIKANPVSYMFYTGYLTIKAYNRMFDRYTLGYPNREVENGLMECLAPMVTDTGDRYDQNFVTESVELLMAGRLDEFLQKLKVFFADIPFDFKKRNETCYHNIFYVVTKLLGFYVQAEYHTSQGSIDMVLATASTIYVIEIKRDSTPEAALAQIERKDYALPFAADGRSVVKVGVNFSTESGTLDGWTVGA